MDKDVIYVYTQTHTQWKITHLIRKGNLVIWMNLEDIMLNEITKTEKDKYCMVSFINGIYRKEKRLNSQEQKVVVARG